LALPEPALTPLRVRRRSTRPCSTTTSMIRKNSTAQCSTVFRVLDSDLPPREKILAYVGAYFDFIASNQTYPKLMQREMMRAREGHSQHIDRLVKTYFQPIYQRVGGLLNEGIVEGEFRRVDPVHFVPSMVAMIVFYFSSAPVMQRIVHFNPLTPRRIAERRAAVLDFISAALFQPRPHAGSAVRNSGASR
jgi:hypothetical protein